jgi:uncharacterized protein (DUF111 family)
VIKAAFEQTKTLGMRVHHSRRRTLERRMIQVGETRVKVAERPGGREGQDRDKRPWGCRINSAVPREARA